MKIKDSIEIYMKLRKDWGQVNPVTKVIPNKKKVKKEKHKKQDTEKEYE